MKTKTGASTIALLAFSGLFAGFANGLLGAGGGIIVTFALAKLLSGGEGAQRDIFANVVAAMLPMTAVSALIYALQGKLEISSSGPFLLPGIIGGIIGALLLGRINTLWLKKLFAALVIFSGIRMLM